MVPGTLVGRSDIVSGRLDVFEDSSMQRRTGQTLERTDGPFLVIANVEPEQTDVTYRPTLVLTARGQLAWVVDFFLAPLEGR